MGHPGLQKGEQRYGVDRRGRGRESKIIIFDRKTGMARTVTAGEMTTGQAAYDHRTSEFPGYVQVEFWALWNEGQRTGWK